MTRSSIVKIFFLSLSLFFSAKALGSKYRITDEDRSSAWFLGLAGYQHSLKSGDANNVLGTATAVQLGYTHIDDTWMLLSSLDVISGPYLSPHQQERNLDYSGTGTTLLVASSAEGADIRSYSGNYGFALGISYMDIVGRVVGERFDSEQRIDKLVMRVTNLSFMPSIFFTWLEPKARKVSNRPQDLNTRIEGYFLNIGFQVPMIANYTLRYDRIEEERTSIKEKGDLFGFSIIVSVAAILGV